MTRSSFPQRVLIQEVGPRDGLQIETKILSVDERLALIDALAVSGLSEIEVGSFVNPKAVPQMAETAAVVQRLVRREGVAYRGLWLNQQGLERALATGGIDMEGRLSVAASETFIRRNTNRGIADALAEMPAWIARYEAAGIDTDTLSIMAAFGCNFEGPIAPEKVIGLVASVQDILCETGGRLRHLRLADTMGWADPIQVQSLIAAIRDRWPDLKVRLHLHDTRGLGIANVFAALQMGISEFDAAVGGLGGCPFAGNPGAAGNVCTEEVVFLCEELGLETGVDLDALVEASLLAETLLGHTLPGNVSRGGTRKRIAAANQRVSP